ncbi:hypothetical protein A6A40_17350 (plasmid) [Azospirillum humicireducens]|uniref:B30.2/SPRY domain-containing protein n=1 Tax=Azospirillum humicireducens TaxID=1226968 RepID=A0A2R4VQU3_9PROT|nr:hypothetical protein [Azospirillum humicireducens]AWB06818.1 hypothetical protein A6A40_17350 [Azospirillum humicireducens]
MTMRPTAEIDRLSNRYYNENPYSAENPGGLDESDDGLTAGHVTNFPDALQAVGTVVKFVGDVALDVIASEVNAAASATAAAGSAQSAQLIAQATAADRQATGQDRQATAADRQAVATDKVAVHNDRLAADADAQATAADRQAVAADKVAVHADRQAADADAQATAADRQAVAQDKAAVHADRLATEVAAAAAQTWNPANYVPKTGGGFTGQVGVPIGLSAVPGLAFVGDSDTGLAQVAGPNTLSLVTGGAEAIRAEVNGGAAYLYLIGATGAYGAMRLQVWSDGNVYLDNTRNGGSVIVRTAQGIVGEFIDTAGASRNLRFRASTTTPEISTSAGALNLTSATGEVLVNGAPIGGGEDTAASIAAAATVNLGSTSAKAIRITAGAGPITAWGVAPAGAHRDITFATSVVLTYNATSAILTGGTNITTVAGDTCRMESLGAGNWKMLSYQRATGRALNGATAQALSSTDKASGITISNNGLTATNSAGGVLAGRALSSMSSPVYWEVMIDVMPGVMGFGIASASVGLTDYISNNPAGYAYIPGGQKATNSTPYSFGAGWGAGSRLCFAFDPASGKLWAGQVSGGVAVWGGGGDPTSGDNPMFITSGTMYPAYSFNGQGAAVTFAFAAAQQVAAAPAGFSAFG